ncbi:MAG TPA: hypothetical protein VK324_16110 [Tepidisphaeraceae bacterium]|nr:hypothetical protein [Tepidisphaeraceae bacterium]
MAAFEYRQAQEIRDTFARHGVRYFFIGKSGTILLGYPDTTQDADLIFASDGIERFDDAWRHRVDVEGFPVCHPDDIIASKVAANRVKDRESLPRLQSFRDYWIERQRPGPH